MEGMLKKTGKHNMHKNIIIIICFFLLTASVLAQDIEMNATVNAKEVGLGQQIRYSISVSGNVQNLPQPKLPSLTDFEVYNAGQSSSFQFINGQVSVSKTYNYSLVPQKEGAFTIGAAQITHKGKVYQTQPITITVSKSIKPKPTKQPSVEERFFGQKQACELFIKTIVDKKSVYVNEPVVLTYKLYYRNIGIRNMGFRENPDFSGFWGEDIPPNKIQKRQRELINGKYYYTMNLYRKILFATAPGKKYIKGAKFQFIIEDFFSFFGRKVNKESNPVVINVNILPSKNKPSDFNGTIGNYNISTKLSTKNLVQNEPFVLKIIISGTGNIKSIGSLAEPKLENFRIYDKHTSINVQKSISSLSGNKTFEYILIPELAGKLEIPSFTFAYFNYAKKKYETLRTKSLTIKTSPGKPGQTPVSSPYFQKADVKLIGKDIRFIRENIKKIKNQGDYFFNNDFMWFLIFFPLAILGTAFYFYNYRQKMESDVTFAKASRAFKTAKKHLSQIEKHLNKNSLDNIPVLFEKMLAGYISDKFNIPRSQIVIDRIKKILTRQKLDKELISKIEDLYNQINIFRYSPTEANEENYIKLLYNSNDVLNNIEKNIRI